MKTAVTVLAELMLTTQVPVPLQPPPVQPLSVLPVAGAAISVTEVPLLKLEMQVAPQSIPAGLLVTVPEPAPDLATARV
jgi:hypothetical protein